MSSDLLDALMNRGDKILFFKRLFCLIMWEHLWFQAERHLPLLAWRRVTSISKIQLFDHMQIIILLVIMICWLVGWLIVAALMFATWLPPALFSISGSGRDWSQQRGLWQALQHRLYADRVAGRHPLPSATAFLWSHLLCKTAVLFTRNCYQRRGQKKNDHMPWAADLCFLYLHVSQNTALYRNTEKRPQQTSSRTEGFVFRVHIKVGRTQL